MLRTTLMITFWLEVVKLPCFFWQGMSLQQAKSFSSGFTRRAQRACASWRASVPRANPLPKLTPRLKPLFVHLLDLQSQKQELQDDDQCNTCQLVILEASSVLSQPVSPSSTAPPPPPPPKTPNPYLEVPSYPNPTSLPSQKNQLIEFFSKPTGTSCIAT